MQGAAAPVSEEPRGALPRFFSPYFEGKTGEDGTVPNRPDTCQNGTGNLVEQALLDQRRQHLALAIRHVGAREVLADGGLGDAAAFDDAAFFVAIQCFVG